MFFGGSSIASVIFMTMFSLSQSLNTKLAVISEIEDIDSSMFIELAANSFHNTTEVIHKKTFFKYFSTNTFKSLQTVCNAIAADKLGVLISAASCQTSQSLSWLSKTLHIPYVALVSEPCFLEASSNNKFAFILNDGVHASDLVLTDIISSKEIKRIVLFFEESNSLAFEGERGKMFRNRLRSTNIFAYELTEASMDSLASELEYYKSSGKFENFVVVASTETCNALLKMVAENGLLNNMYTWIMECNVNNVKDIYLPKIGKAYHIGTIVALERQTPKHEENYHEEGIYEMENKTLLRGGLEVLARALLYTGGFQIDNTAAVCQDLPDDFDYDWNSDSYPWSERSRKLVKKLKSIGEEKHLPKHQSNAFFSIFMHNRKDFKWIKTAQWSSYTGLVNVKRNEFFQPPIPPLNRKLQIVTVIEAPFVQLSLNPRGFNFTGYCMDMLKELSLKVGFQYEVYNVSTYGKKNSRGYWEGAVGEVAYKRADMAVSGMLITSQREDVVDFSTNFMEYGVGIFYKKENSEKTYFGFMEPLNIQVWGCIAATTFIAGILLFLATRLSPYTREGTAVDSESDYVRFNILNSIWFTMSSIMQQGGDMHPRTASGRILGSFWWFFTLIITATYTANLAAFLTVVRMETPVDSLQNLANQHTIKYGTVRDSPIHLDFMNQSEMNPLYERISNYFKQDSSVLVDTAEEGYERVEKGKYAFMWDDPILQWRKSRNCDYTTVGKSFLNKDYGIALQKGSPLSENISSAILMLQEEGILKKLQVKWFEQATRKCPTEEMKPGESNAKGIEFEKVSGVFYVLIFGTVVSFLTGIGEIFWYRSTKGDKMKTNVINPSQAFRMFPSPEFHKLKQPLFRKASPLVLTNQPEFKKSAAIIGEIPPDILETTPLANDSKDFEKCQTKRSGNEKPKPGQTYRNHTERSISYYRVDINGYVIRSNSNGKESNNELNQTSKEATV